MDRKAWIVVTLCLLGMGINGWWMMTHQPPPKAPVPVAAAPAKTPVDTAAQPGTTTPPKADPATPEAVTVLEQKVELNNSLVTYTFTTNGGGIATARLLDTKDNIILNAHGKAAVGAISGAAKAWDDLNYKIVEQDAKHIVFEAETPEHLVYRKEYSFSEGQGSDPHLLNYNLTITNKSATKITKDSLYIYTGAAMELRPDEIVKPGFCWNDAGDAASKDTSYFGAGWFSGEVTELRMEFQRVRWAGVMSRFYTMLISTKEDQPGKIWAMPFPVDHNSDEFKDNSRAAQDKAIHGGVSLPALDLDVNATKSFALRVYMGPKVYQVLSGIDDVEPDRQQRYVMFYGWFTFVSKRLVWLMRVFHDWFGNWGTAIILLTLTVRTILWPVQARANSTMKRMGMLSPKLKELQAKHKDEPQKQQAEMMKLYREYGVNPLGGCLPMFVQIPVFFGFYRVLQYAAELRGQSFLWVPDLSLPDTITHIAGYPLNPLPLVMVLTNFLQMKFTPQPQSTDNTQRRLMMFMPLIFLFICYNFASALALYWTTQNIFSIFQAQVQLRFQKDPVLTKVAPAGSAASSASGSKKKDKPGPPRLGGGGTKSTRND